MPRRRDTKIPGINRQAATGVHTAADLEWNLARVRLLVAVMLIAGELATAPRTVADGISILYGLFASGVLVGLARRAPDGRKLSALVPAVDLAAATCLTVIANLPVVHFFPLFVLVSTAYRAGTVQTVLSGLVLASALVLEAHPAVAAVFGEPSVPSHIFVLGGYTMVVAVLVGYLAQRERGARSEAAAIGRMFEHVRLDAGPVAILRELLDEFRAIFGARQVLLAVDDTTDDVALLWRTRPRGDGAATQPVVQRLGAAGRARYWFPVGAHVGACMVSRVGAATIRATAVDASGIEVAGPAHWPTEFAEAHPAQRVFVLPQVAVNGFRLRVFVLDPVVDRPQESLRLLQTLVRRMAPVLYNLFLERRLRTRLKQNERARLARELHDGVIQSLIAIEMRLDVAKRRIESSPSEAATDLGEAQRQLRGQIVDVRTLMNQLRPPDVDQRRLIQLLSDATERFHQTTGIETRFERGVDELDLPPRVCGELARVVDEALMNIRKHAGARRVAVSLGSDGGALTLSIEDDGRGFGFAGRMTQPDLDAFGVGPLVIKERVQSIGGRVAIDSRPGRGATVEVQVPRYAHG